MAGFDAVPLPSCEPNFRPDAVAAQIHAWTSAEPMRALVSTFGGALPVSGGALPVSGRVLSVASGALSVSGGALSVAGDLLAWLDDFSDRHWNFRKPGMVERDQVTAPSFPAATADLIVAAAAALHLVDADRPPHPAYDHLLVLGGLGRACLQRTEHAARLVRAGTVAVPEIAALGSFRPLTEAETALPALAGSRYEVDALEVGIRGGFGFGEPVLRESSAGEVTHHSWAARTYRAAGCPEVHVLAAPSSEPESRRANTPDTYEFWARRVNLRATDRILVVTSPLYVPFQHSDAIRMLALRYGCGIDTIGFDPEHATIPLAPGATNPDRYLQEIRSAILSMRRLREALTETIPA